MNTFPQNRPHFLHRTFNRFLPNTQVRSLAIIVLISFLLIYSLSGLLLPVFVSIGLAYLLEGIVQKAQRFNMPRLAAVWLVFSLFSRRTHFFAVYFNSDYFSAND